MKTNNRGEVITLVVLIVALVGGGAYFGFKYAHTGGSREGTPLEKVDKAKDKASKKEAEIEGKLNTETAAQLHTAQGASVATGVAISAAQATTATGQLPVRELATAKTLNDTANQALDQAIGKTLDPKELGELKQMVAQLNSEVASARTEGNKALTALNGALQASVNREKVLDQQLVAQKAENEKIIGDAQKKADAWALERDATAAKWDRMMLGVWIFVGIFVFALVGPWIAKIFPAVAPFATAAGTILAPSVAWAKDKLAHRADDLVSLVDANKRFVENIDPSKVEEFKKSVNNWWENDHTGMAFVEEAKKRLRL